MRIKQKKQIVDLLETVSEGLGFAASVSQNNLEQSNEMLRNCEYCLIFLSELLEGEQKVVTLISQAKIVLKEMFSISEEEAFNNYKLRIEEFLNTVFESVVHGIRNEFEIAFMPYKSSMWDSFDSIYKEALEDQECVCYVVPIPYYEKNSSGEVIRFCYEGNELPEYIHTTPFEVYDLEERQPDIIYVHNPYDDYNILTMVNPRFFSGNLAKYTEMLVYVPYFLAGSAKNDLLGITPFYNNVHKIITQSEKTKQAFLHNGIKESVLLNLGSPKIDAAHETIEKKPLIPHHWNYISADKKTFLFNTGIADLLSTDNWLEQIEQVVNYFLIHSQQMLIWRPHPLTKVTLNTMRPHILEAYEAVNKAAQTAPNIIIDDNKDAYPALALSDALISDYSSIMLQYIITGKPVLSLIAEEMRSKDRYYFSDYKECYFVDHNQTVLQALSSFVDLVTYDKDWNKEARLKRFEESISFGDGSSGRRIHQKIKAEVLKKIADAEKEG